jgi:dipeptide transport system ATP-binding protein
LTAILEAKNVAKHYALRGFLRSRGIVKALEDVSFEVNEGEILSVVGESGCGKTTLAKVLMQIENVTGGQILLGGKDLTTIPRHEARKDVQMIFQDPYSSLNARKKAWKIIAEPLFINTDQPKDECKKIAKQMMNKVGLRADTCERYPHMFSGGQRQRIGIARALVTRPKLLICDEPVSALDVSIQAQILNLLMDLRDEMKLSYIFISHDLSVVKYISDRILIIYLGKVVEYGTKAAIFANPVHPYTQTLLGSSPKVASASKKIFSLQGEIPSRINPPKGCPFETRCPFVQERCREVSPPLAMREGRLVACHRADEGLDVKSSESGVSAGYPTERSQHAPRDLR